MEILKTGTVFPPMMPSDIDEVLSIEASVSAFPWGRGHFMDSILGGHYARICRVNGKIVGYAIVMLAVDEAHLLNIGVDGKFHGQGFGWSLLCRGVDWARGGGMKSLLLEVCPSNERALMLYRRYGFQQIGVRRGYYLSKGGQREDALVLRYTLGAAT